MANLEAVVDNGVLLGRQPVCQLLGGGLGREVACEIEDLALLEAPIRKERLLPCQAGVQIRDALLQQRVRVDPLLVRLREGGRVHLVREAADQVRLQRSGSKVAGEIEDPALRQGCN